MKQIECPICHEMHDENEACPRCSFEFHQIFTPSNKYQEMEQKRIAAHTKWWEEINEKKVDRTQYEEIEQELNTANARIAELEQESKTAHACIAELEQELKRGKKPVAFLISEQKTVYCLYDGQNTFGSAKTNTDCEQHQKIILPGISIRPVHFSITITSEENRKHCAINEYRVESTTIFVNSTTNPVGMDTLLNDGDEIIISMNKKEGKIKYRININK